MNEFERESATMDMKEEMMSDAVDDVMDDELEDEEEEGDKILKEVLDEIGVSLSHQVCLEHPLLLNIIQFIFAVAHRCADKHCDSFAAHRKTTARRAW